MNVPGLADAVTPVLSLRVHGRIPITVIEDDRIGTGQVNAHSTTTRW